MHANVSSVVGVVGIAHIHIIIIITVIVDVCCIIFLVALVIRHICLTGDVHIILKLEVEVTEILVGIFTCRTSLYIFCFLFAMTIALLTWLF